MIVTPDGIAYVDGPYNGKDNDWYMFKESAVERRMRRMLGVANPAALNGISRERLFLYGNPAYACRFAVFSPYGRRGSGAARLTAAQRIFNRILSRYRISVEHCFGEAFRKWTYTSFRKGLRQGS